METLKLKEIEQMSVLPRLPLSLLIEYMIPTFVLKLLYYKEIEQNWLRQDHFLREHFLGEPGAAVSFAPD